MKAEWLVEQGGMVLMITHPDYLCHPKLVRSKQKGVGRRYDGWLGDENRDQGSEVRGRRAKNKYINDGWLGNDDRDVQEVREKGIVEKKWFGSLLEQYAVFLNWFRREFEGRYWHCLPWELADGMGIRG